MKKQVVLIEQNPAKLEDLKRIFALEPEFALDIASTGSEGYNKAKNMQPSFVVISDTVNDIDFFQLLNVLSNEAPYSKKAVILTVENPALQVYLANNFKVNVIVTQNQVAERLIMLMKQSVPSGVPQPAQTSASQQFGAQNPQYGGSLQQPWNAPVAQTMPGSVPTQNVQQGFPLPQQGFAPPQQVFTGHPGYNTHGADQSSQGFSDQPSMKGVRTLKQTVIAISSPKGGVGKSTLSKELALAFASVKISGHPLKVCLVDFDLDFGDSASMLKLSPHITISTWIADIKQKVKTGAYGNIKYSQQQVERYLLTHKDTGLRVLAAPTSHSDDIEITDFDIETVIDNIKGCDFDIVIFDTANNTANHTMIALERAAIILLVTTLDVAAIYDSKILVDTLRTIEFPMQKIKLLINRMPKNENNGVNVHEISQMLSLPILDVIPEYPLISKITNWGNAAVLERDTEFSVAIRRLGNHLFPVFNKAIRTSTQHENKSLIGKLFGGNGRK